MDTTTAAPDRLTVSPLPQQSQARDSVRPYPWIISPALDLLFCCGGLLWLFFAVHYFVLGPDSGMETIRPLLIVVILATHLLSETHNIATLSRIYGSAEDRSRFRFYTIGLAGSCIPFLLIGLFVPYAANIFTKIYLLWVAQHFTAQTYGIALLYCYKRGYKMSNQDKFSLKLLMIATMTFAIVRQFTDPSWGGSTFLGLNIPFWGPLPDFIFDLTIAFVFFAVLGFFYVVVKNLIFNRQLFPVPAVLLVITGVAVWCTSPDTNGTLWLYVPAFYHGSQYLMVSVSYYLKDKGLPDGLPSSQIVRALASPLARDYFVRLIMVAAVAYIAVPRVLEQIGIQYTVAFATIFCVINFHHFLTDAAIWKLRDPRTRELLVN